MNPKYPGMQYVTFGEAEELIARFIKRLPPPYQYGAETIVTTPVELRGLITAVFYEMVKERTEP